MQAHPALVLNADFRPLSYFPLSLLSWQDAITAVFKTRLSPSTTNRYRESTKMRLPSVVALRDYIPMPKRVAFTRFNVFLRDRFRCQYCGETFSAKDLTFEHVIPRSKGGETSWTNIVAACDPCNVKKDNRTNMKPLRAPFVPTAGELMTAKRAFPPGYLHETWLDFLYWDAELQR